MNDGLMQFLRDRLATEEDVARAATPRPFNWSGTQHGDGDRQTQIDAEHIARYNPARVLAEIEAKQDVVRLAERAHDYHETFTNGLAAAMEHTLKLFAVAYADHPYYREEWRP